MDQRRYAGRRSKRKGMRIMAITSISILVAVALITALVLGNLTPILMIVAAAAVIGLING